MFLFYERLDVCFCVVYLLAEDVFLIGYQVKYIFLPLQICENNNACLFFKFLSILGRTILIYSSLAELRYPLLPY